MSSKPAVNIITRKISSTPAPFPSTHGVIQMADGSLLVMSCIPPNEAGDKYFDMLKNCDPGVPEEVKHLRLKLGEIGIEVKEAQRLRRAGLKLRGK